MPKQEKGVEGVTLTRKEKRRSRDNITKDFPEFDTNNIEVTSLQPEKATVKLLQNLCLQVEEAIDVLEQIRDKK